MQHTDLNPIASLNFTDHDTFERRSYMSILFVVIFILIVSLLMGFYHKLILVAYYIPESTMLITVGVVFGFIITFFDETVTRTMRLTPTLFFYIFLPPIVLDASYTLHDRSFTETLLPVLVFAILGTFANFFIVGYVLYGISIACDLHDPGITKYTVLLFSAIISAVDPVAVLAIFKEIGVNRKLYFLVFGESLLNDGVSIVVYEALLSFYSSPQLDATSLGYGAILFIVVGVGGLMIGILGGFAVCMITKELEASLLLEPVVLIAFAFLAYLIAQMFHCSGIFALVVCGIMESMYAFENVSEDSQEFTRRVLHTTATLSEAIVFLLLGIAVSSMKANLLQYIYAAVVICVCVATRFIVIFSMTLILKCCNLLVEKISVTDQFVIAYGGLRGAVAFSLVQLAEEDIHIKIEPMMSLTLYVIIFTVVPIGLTLKPIVELMEISREQADNMLFAEIGKSIVAYTMAGIESIVDRWGVDKIIEHLSYFNDRYVRPILQQDPLSHKKKLITFIPEPKESGKQSRKSEGFERRITHLKTSRTTITAILPQRTETVSVWGRDRFDRLPTQIYRRRDNSEYFFRTMSVEDNEKKSNSKWNTS